MNPRESAYGIRWLARCAILSACAACVGTGLKDLADKKAVAYSDPDRTPSFIVALGYDIEASGCHSLSSVHASVNGVALVGSPNGPTYAEGHVVGCNFPGFALAPGDTLPPSADGQYEVVMFDSSMRISAKFGDFFGPATATLRSPSSRIAHPQDEIIVDFSPAPTVYTVGGVAQTRAGFSLDMRDLASYQDVQLTGSSASFRLPANVLGQGRLLTWWLFDVPTVRCQGVEACTGFSYRRADLGPFEIRN